MIKGDVWDLCAGAVNAGQYQIPKTGVLDVPLYSTWVFSAGLIGICKR
jgi:hypothetical protein